MTDFARGKVSKKKDRYQQGGFDLDLTYKPPPNLKNQISSTQLAP